VHDVFVGLRRSAGDRTGLLSIDSNGSDDRNDTRRCADAAVELAWQWLVSEDQTCIIGSPGGRLVKRWAVDVVGG
jgi:hypothetical protein